jgi:hypothetical protein
MDLNAWFHWLFPSPAYFLLALAGLLALFGLIAGLTASRSTTEAERQPTDDDDLSSRGPWWKRQEECYQEWNALQVREQHRTAGKDSRMD